MKKLQEFPIGQIEWVDLCDESFLVMVLDSMYDALVVVDSTGRIVYVNPAYTRELNVMPNKVVGRKIQDIAPESVIMKVLETGQPEIGVQSRIIKLGIDVIVNSTPIFKDGRLSGVVSVFRDVTTVRKLSEQLEIMKDYQDYLQEQLFKKVIPEEFKGIIGNNIHFRSMLTRAMKASRSDITVLIKGETGTGKELLAHAIHNASKRKQQPFIEINCAAIPENLLESELFGYEGGAFTGARKTGKPGKFELADKGTLFLDEIGDMSLMLQSKLLRIIQEQRFERIGGSRSIRTDVRIIAATNKNLESMIKENSFRKDLFYRLNVFTLDTIPLRDRKDDIPVLSFHFLKNFTEHERKKCRLSQAVINTFLKYDWPGNVRELMNIMEAAVVSCNSKYIEIRHLPAYFTAAMSLSSKHDMGERSESLHLDSRIAEIEKECILKALQEASNNKSKAMKILGISRSTFYDKIKKYNISITR